MTPNQLAEQIEQLIIESNDRFGRRMTAVQNALYNDLMAILRKLYVSREGYIVQSAENRKVLRDAQNKFDDIIGKSSYQSDIERHLSIMPKVAKLNQAYFESVSKAFSPTRIFIKAIQQGAIDTVNNYLLQDGLAAQVKMPINEILNQNINQGGSFAGMQKQLETFIKGAPGADGRLKQYAKGILKDSLFQYSRSYQQSVSSDLGLTWYRYVGGLMDTTRQFCGDRNGGFFHQKEIESWALLNWKGKNPLTTESSIFTYCGGYNCIHQAIPVHESAVPKEWLDRSVY